MKRSPLILALALAAASGPAHAKSYTAHYIVPSPPGVLFTPPICTPETAIGGCAFAIGANDRPVEVRVRDDITGLPVAWSACQDVDGNGDCDLFTEPYVSSCGEDRLLPATFQKGKVTSVFVKAIEPVLCDGAENQGLQGTITLITT